MSRNRDTMMILAIDTAGPVLGIALVRTRVVVDSREEDCGFRHVEDLVPGIRQLINDARLTPAEIDALAVSAGPGSFTGLRVGMATAKGIALARGIPVYSVSTLEGFARQEREARMNAAGNSGAGGTDVTVIVPILDARKGRVYGAIFDYASGSRLTGDMDLPMEKLLSRVGEHAGGGGWTAIGPDSPALTEHLGAVAAISAGRSAASGVGLIACDAIASGALPDDPYAGPTYLRGGDIGEKKRILRFEGTHDGDS